MRCLCQTMRSACCAFGVFLRHDHELPRSHAPGWSGAADAAIIDDNEAGGRSPNRLLALRFPFTVPRHPRGCGSCVCRFARRLFFGFGHANKKAHPTKAEHVIALTLAIPELKDLEEPEP